ncbi:MAG: hypothetical protein A2X28_00325 [Elusimicrobia bacterium GWA2_56_46]|nr:MAG: hypothetical protein A2X28_00325 [Elusimicrobia bacterium GWA2_56_46]OGR55813.1 MAG: hypothetical protein A2X39_05700 [Elusimicrobia bacterium GWC2_56_31]HBB65842.1 hypothetical protein [Elusimicrobiota bacterium]HBW22255.1 hypothetical protein [Elusimicrobiota bacterium]
MNKIFSIPFNGDTALMEEAAKTGKVAEIYFAGPAGNDLSQSYPVYGGGGDFSPRTISELIALCRDYEIRSNLLCNKPTLVFDDCPAAFRYIKSLKYLDAVTVADPYALAAFVKEFPGKDIQCSVSMVLDSFEKVRTILKLGAGTVNLHIDLNRNEAALKALFRLKKSYPGFKVKLLANSVCYHACPFYKWHDALETLAPLNNNKNSFGALLDANKCVFPKPTRSDLLRRPFIRPEDVDYYLRKNRADIIKLAFRSNNSETLKRTLWAYFEGSYKGNLGDVVGFGGQWRNLFCDNNRFPAGFAKKVMRAAADPFSGFFDSLAGRVFVDG